MSAINTNVSASLMKFTFTDDDGDCVASFKLNPADIKLAQRCEELESFFGNLSEKFPDNATLEDMAKFNDELEDKICYLLGYDAKQSLFGLFSATSIMGDGSLFAVKVIEKITAAISPEIEKRKRTMAKAVVKHTAKYTK